MSEKPKGDKKVGADNMMASATNNKSKLFVNEAEIDNEIEGEDTLISRANGKSEVNNDLKIRFLQKIRLELDVAQAR